ncbi:M48 family metalloprotease [Tahibacter caeni]|uniref:M48 family metalloprotease n=1 Tax=Tahibacter caeni TaxID=1453545 RepID=UPI0021498040|nr:M48 family metalloprotease [Tahibacter caeni]
MQRAEFEALVSRLETLKQNDPRGYQLRLVGLVLLGYGYLAGIVALLIALLAAAALSVLFLKALAIKLVIPLAFFIWVVLRALWVRIAPPVGFAVTAGTAPALFERIERLRRALKAPRFHRVLITDDFNAAVMQVPLLGLFGWHRNFLLLGLPLLKCLTPEQLDAVLAHEFGHLAGGHARFGNWLYRSRRIWLQLAESIGRAGGGGSFLFRRFFQWYVPYFHAWTFPLARANEYEADAVAARLTSPRVAAQALTSVNVGGALLQERFWPELHRQADDQPQPAYLPYTQIGQGLDEDFRSDDGRRWLAESLKRETSYADTHPALSDRLRALRHPASVAPPAAGASADHLLGELRERVIATFDARWQEQISHGWRQRYDEVQKGRSRLGELNASVAERELGVDEKLERAHLLADVGRDKDAALQQFQAAVQAHPDSAAAHFFYGQGLLARDDESGATHLRRAIELEPGARGNVGEILRDYYWRRGDKAAADTWHDTVERHEAISDQARAERARLTVHDKLEPHGLGAERIAELAQQLRELGIYRAWLARRTLRHMPEHPQLVLGFRATRPLRWHSAARAEQQQNRILSRVAFPHDVIVLAVDGDNARFGRKLAKIAGSRLY